MTEFYGEISLKKLGDIVRQHEALVRNVHFNKPEPHDEKMLKIIVREKQTEFSDAFIAVSCKKDEQKEGLSYIIGNLKISNGGIQQQQAAPADALETAPQPAAPPIQPQAADKNDLPF